MYNNTKMVIFMVNVAVIGVGFVGLTHVTARFGHEVIGYDISKDKIDAFNSADSKQISKYVYEIGLSEIVSQGLLSKRLKFTTNIEEISNCEVFFMCLPTPYTATGESDLSYLFSAADSLVPILKKNGKFRLIVNKSTVPIGTAEKLYKYLSEKGVTNFDVASNPEFIPEGEAVKHTVHSAKIVVGASNEKSFDLLRQINYNFYDNPHTVYVETNAETAEAIKYASNVLLYNQIVMWQSIPAAIAESNPKVRFEDLKKGALADTRIAKWGSFVTAGAGGSCFKKDTLSLARQLEATGMDPTYINMIDAINEDHKTYLITRAEDEGNYSFDGKCVAILGTAFKKATNDMRESNVLAMIPKLLEKGVTHIRLYDPLALEHTRIAFNPKHNKEYSKISFHESSIEAQKDSDVAIIATDHKEFKTLAQQ